MKKSFAVVGLGRFGTNVALTLMESGAQVLAIDSNPECEADFITGYLCGDDQCMRDRESERSRT